VKLAKPNYRHAKKQKEAARKARQDAKHQRKNAPDSPDAPDAAAGVDVATGDEVGAPAASVPAASDA
jgi:hypothetical protein